MKRFWLLLIVSFLSLQCLNAQEQDTLQMSPREDSLYFNQPPESTNSVVLKKKHSPKKATLLALIPGAGQAYNKKYWKIPIVYAGFGVTTYFAITNGDDYKLYKLAYDYKMGYTTSVSDRVKAEAAKYSADNLITLRDYYRGKMELFWILTAAWYVVQIIDANVDAHFFYYDISDELTLQVEPQWNPPYNEYAQGNGIGSVGLSFKLNF